MSRTTQPRSAVAQARAFRIGHGIARMMDELTPEPVLSSTERLIQTFEERGHQVFKVNGKSVLLSTAAATRRLDWFDHFYTKLVGEVPRILEPLLGNRWHLSRGLPQVFVVDAWDEKEGESHVAVFASQGAAKAHLASWFDDRGRAGVKPEHNGLFGGVLRRKVRA